MLEDETRRLVTLGFRPPAPTALCSPVPHFVTTALACFIPPPPRFFFDPASMKRHGHRNSRTPSPPLPPPSVSSSPPQTMRSSAPQNAGPTRCTRPVKPKALPVLAAARVVAVFIPPVYPSHGVSVAPPAGVVEAPRGPPSYPGLLPPSPLPLLLTLLDMGERLDARSAIPAAGGARL